ncbi:rRNA maturation RNase YbeY [Palleronia sediminis]|uniref:Endoribonuclease YbeY n=1 Tax=Palleronia sediminis TaxID=2547833 RepID=A0A4R6AFB1_9RHOB|nr:rRNA maturation RNase YbeY [Palleronia sediminis]TDL81782.1 rRNA maturation RNase YbeY [Palleronia sediminis]
MNATPDAGAVSVETVIEDAAWDTVPLDALAGRAARATLGRLGLGAGEIVVLGCDDARIAGLNADFRGKPRPTNVLSWPSAERGARVEGQMPAPPDTARDAELGDIALAFGVCATEARAAGLALEAHVTHLLVHAVLHLLGFDHDRDGDAALMERLETEILAELGLHDPYSGDVS